MVFIIFSYQTNNFLIKVNKEIMVLSKCLKKLYNSITIKIKILLALIVFLESRAKYLFAFCKLTECFQSLIFFNEIPFPLFLEQELMVKYFLIVLIVKDVRMIGKFWIKGLILLYDGLSLNQF